MKQPKNFFEKIRDVIISYSYSDTRPRKPLSSMVITNYEYKVTDTSSIAAVSKTNSSLTDASELWLMPINDASRELGYCLRLRIFWGEERIDTIRPKVGDGTVHSTVWTRGIKRDDVITYSDFRARVLVSLLRCIIINPK